MKKLKLTAVILIALILISVMRLTTFATNEKFMVVKMDSEDSYIIYIQDTLNTPFEFAFSNTKDANDLNYISSTKDEQGNNVAYVDSALKTLLFRDNSTYLWVKTNDGANIMNGEEVTLASAIKNSQLESINFISKTITINANAKDEKISINGNKEDKYFYQLFSIGTSEEYQRLVSLVEEISKYNENTNVYTKLQAYIEFNELYNKLAPALDDANWIETKNLEIEKPYDAQENQKYILWLKNENGTRDIQILTAYQNEVTNAEVKEKIVEESATLPVTYDNTVVLYIALAIVLVAIVVMLVVRKIVIKNSKE